MINKLEILERDENAVYDQDWVELVLKAKQSGLTAHEVRSFLQKGESYTSMKLSLPKTDLQHV